MRTTLALVIGTLLAAGHLPGGQPISIAHIAPSISQLGEGWTSNRVVVLVDQLNSTNDISNEGEGWLKAAYNVVGKRGCEAQMVLRYGYGSASVLAWVNRFKDRESIGDDWGRDKDTKVRPEALPKVGDEVRFYQRAGMHNNIAFRRGNYLIEVEGVSTPIEKLKQLAEALDSNLLKAQKAAGVAPAGVSLGPEPAATQFVAEGTVDYYNSWAAEDLKTHPGFTPVVTSTMNFTVIVSNACYLMRLEPTKENAILYHEAGFDGKTLYFLSRMNFSSPQNAPGVRSGPNVATAWIYDRQRVVYSLFAHEMGPVWLMFASGDYLRGVTNGLVEPPLTLGLFENDDYYARPFMIPAQWALQPAFPFLPLSVTCQDDGESKTAPPFRNARREPPFDAGFTNLVFKVTGTGNFDGVAVPCSGELETYRVDVRGKPELRPYTRYRVALNRWSMGIPATCFIPKLPGPTSFNDTRHYASRGSHCIVADQWPTEEQSGRK